MLCGNCVRRTCWIHHFLRGNAVPLHFALSFSEPQFNCTWKWTLALMEDTSPEVQVQHRMSRASRDSGNHSSLPEKRRHQEKDLAVNRKWAIRECYWISLSSMWCQEGYSPNTLLWPLLQDLNQFVIRIPSDEMWAEPWWWKDFKGSHFRISFLLVFAYQWPWREN